MKPIRLVNLKFLFCSGKICNCGILFFMVMFVTGCSHDFVIRKPDGSVIGPGTVDFSAGNTKGAIMLKINGTTYRGTWDAHKLDESRSIAAIYGPNSKKYAAYSLGNGNYLREGQVILRSDRGEELKCEFTYRGVRGQGRCESELENFDFIITELDWLGKDSTN